MLAALALLLFFSPALVSASRDSREGVDLRNIDGVRAVLSSLRPGVVARFSFGTSANDPITVRGHEITCSYGAGSVEVYSSAAADATLLPSVTYLAYISGGAVVIRSV